VLETRYSPTPPGAQDLRWVLMDRRKKRRRRSRRDNKKKREEE
jgi:hypothetical protein